MNREEFMKELEYLLQDIPDEEKSDALQYYWDYLEEAGPDNEASVISDFGSPERIAAIIRSDITGSLKDGGEFTESGYQDERFKDPNYQVVKRYDLPDIQEEKKERRQDPPKTSKVLKTVLWIVLIIVAFPVIMGVSGGVFGVLFGIFGILLSLLIVTAVLTVAMLLSGIVVFVFGLVQLAVNPLDGMVLLGLGLLLIGIGLLCLAISILVYGRFLPFVFRSVIDGSNRLFHRQKKSL